jgi:hypothetical protein
MSSDLILQQQKSIDRTLMRLFLIFLSSSHDGSPSTRFSCYDGNLYQPY